MSGSRRVEREHEELARISEEEDKADTKFEIRILIFGGICIAATILTFVAMYLHGPVQ